MSDFKEFEKLRKTRVRVIDEMPTVIWLKKILNSCNTEEQRLCAVRMVRKYIADLFNRASLFDEISRLNIKLISNDLKIVNDKKRKDLVHA